MIRLDVFVRCLKNEMSFFNGFHNRDPYVTKYKRDVAMSWITWLSNTGKEKEKKIQNSKYKRNIKNVKKKTKANTKCKVKAQGHNVQDHLAF